jgi:hypothetical protein
VGTSLVVVEASATITTDAPALLVGGLLCLAGLGVVQQRCSPWWLLPTGLFATAIKPTNLTVVGAVLVFLGLQLLAPDRPTSVANDEGNNGRGQHVTAKKPAGLGSALAPAAILACAAVVPTVAWSVVSAQIQTPDVKNIPMFDMFRTPGLRWGQLADNMFALASPMAVTGTTYLPDLTYTSTLLMLAATCNLLVLAGVGGLAWFGRWRQQSTRMAVATAVSMVISGPVLVVLIYLSLDSYYLIPTRYGLSLLPPAAASLAVAASGRRVGVMALVVLGLLNLTVLWTRTL